MNEGRLMNALLLAALRASVDRHAYFVRDDGRVSESMQHGGDDARSYLRVTPSADVVGAGRQLGNVLAMTAPGSLLGPGGGR